MRLQIHGSISPRHPCLLEFGAHRLNQLIRCRTAHSCPFLRIFRQISTSHLLGEWEGGDLSKKCKEIRHESTCKLRRELPNVSSPRNFRSQRFSAPTPTPGGAG